MQIDPKGLEAAIAEIAALVPDDADPADDTDNQSGFRNAIDQVLAILSALSPAGVTEEEVEAAAREISPHLWAELTHEQRMSDDYAFTSRRDAQERARKQARAALEAWNRRALSPAGTASEMEPVAWVPCSPEWLEAGGDCATAPRIWSDAHKNHLHPAIPPMTEGWQPIETAPRDGTTILMGKFHDGDFYWMASGRIEDGQFWCDFPDEFFVPFSHQNPTHWRPLPAPPKAGD